MSAGCPERPAWVPAAVDPARPASARLYDYLLGGSHFLPVDRALAERVLTERPDLAVLARSNRAFLRRAVRFLAGRGVRQFLDLGSGLPTAGNVHEVAAAVEPRSRVLYVDVDPVAVAHARALLGERPRVRVVEGDLRRPREVLGDPAAAGLLDLAQPVAVLLVSVLQFVADTDDPWAVLSRLRETVPSGSHLVVSHPVLTGRSRPDDALTEVYRLTGTPVALRDVEAVGRFFDGWQLVEPGVVPVPRWRAEPAAGPGADGTDRSFYAGVAVKA